jgi:hypothetical protein
MPRAERALTGGEQALAFSMFGNAIDYAKVRIRRRRWWPFQPRSVIMSPMGHIHVHPKSDLWADDYSLADINLQALFIHEMTHVWQAQANGRWYLPIRRHPFCRYDYAIMPGQKFERYGLEQQGEIMRHAFLVSRGRAVRGLPTLEQYRSIIPFAMTPPEPS